MKKKVVILTSFLGLSTIGFSQFIVKDVYFETHGVSNEGEVVGYSEWAGPYMVWTPENQEVDTIGGVAPGNGVGGRAVFSNDGNFISGTAPATTGLEMAKYNRTTGTWTALGSFGYSWDTFDDKSGGYYISGDGNTVVGNAWVDTALGAYTDAVAWNAAEGFMDLGTLFTGRSTRANAVSGDGSVVIGWQDFNGPWKSAVWRKNPAGGYYPNQYILLDPAGDSTDEFNQMGECTAISGDGNWIGGAGDYANNGNAWMWSQATGVVDLGTLSPGASAYVAAINMDGTMAVGRIQVGPWDPEIPFIWTPSDGMVNLNDYAHDVLGLNTGTKRIYSANCMSPSGDYIAGYGYDTVTLAAFAYRMSATDVSVTELSGMDLTVYPNPVNDLLMINSDGESVKVIVTDAEGKKISETTISGQNKLLDISLYAPGVYFLTVVGVESGENFKIVRVVKK